MPTILMSSFSRALTPGVIASGGSKNWAPGNYIASTTTRNGTIWNNNTGNPATQGIHQRLNNTNDPLGHWKGCLLRFSWAKPLGGVGDDDYLESDDGTYTVGMNKVQSYLDQIAAMQGRRLIVFIQLKTSNPPGATSSDFYHAVPLYMRNSNTYSDGSNYYTTRGATTYQGSYNGQYAYESSNGGPGGFVPNMHVAAVRTRFNALIQEFATRFNGNPNLEAICFSEASIAEPIGSVGAASETVGGVVITRPNTDGSAWVNNGAWFSGMESSFGTARTALSNVQISQWVNADRNDMKTFAPNLVGAGIGLGMPDLCPEEVGCNYRNDITGYSATAPGNIQHCQNAGGLTIVMGHASRPALHGTVVGRCQTSQSIQGQAHVYPAYPGVGTSRQALRDFAVNTVGVTHLLWAHNTGNQGTTGQIDDSIPNNCAKNPWTAYGTYGGQGFNKITDEWIHNAGSTIATVTARPIGW